MATYATGKSSKVVAGTTDVCVSSWSFRLEGDQTDINDPCAAGYKKTVVGNTKVSGSFTGNWDLDSQPTDSPPDLIPSDTAQTLKFYVSAAKFFSISAKITGLTTDAAVDGMVTFSVDWVGDGSPTFPL